MYCNRFSTILYIISDNSLITLMKSGMTTKYWFVKIYLNLLPHLCCVSSMLYLLYKQHQYWRRTSSFFSLRGKFSRQLPTLLCAIPIIAHFYC